MPKIFLCHASEDKAVCSNIHMALTNAGHSVFYDDISLQPGEDYHTKIRQRIETSDIFIFIISPNSLRAGKYTLAELKIAMFRWPRPIGKVLAVQVENVESSLIPAYLGSTNILKPKGNVAAEVQFHIARDFGGSGSRTVRMVVVVSAAAFAAFFAFAATSEISIRQAFSQIVAKLKSTDQDPLDLFPVGRRFADPSVGIPMVVIPPGDFEWRRSGVIGPQVRIGYKLAVSEREVTIGDWIRCAAYDPLYNPCKSRLLPTQPEFANLPITNITREEAADFAAFMSRLTQAKYRLLTEAEWEYAMRGGSKGRFSWGDSESSAVDYAWFRDNSNGLPHAVATKKPNEFGLYDMAGNVWEWVEDQPHTDDYWARAIDTSTHQRIGFPTDGSAWTMFARDDQNVIKGGSYTNEVGLLAANIGSLNPKYKDGNKTPETYKNFGFRVAREIP